MSRCVLYVGERFEGRWYSLGGRNDHRGVGIAIEKPYSFSRRLFNYVINSRIQRTVVEYTSRRVTCELVYSLAYISINASIYSNKLFASKILN